MGAGAARGCAAALRAGPDGGVRPAIGRPFLLRWVGLGWVEGIERAGASERDGVPVRFAGATTTPGSGRCGAGARGRASDARDEALTLDGDVATGWCVRTTVARAGLRGLCSRTARARGRTRSTAPRRRRPRGELDTSLTGFHPYLGIELSERLTAWGVAGYGRGTLTLSDEDVAALETDIDFTMAAGGMRGEVLGGGETGGFGLAVESDALIARTASQRTAGLLATAATVSRLRLGLEGSYALALDGAGTLEPTLEMGVRHDGGDAETGVGVELAGGLRYADPVRGISTDFNVRGLVAHEDSGYEEWGASGTLHYDPMGASTSDPRSPSPGTGRVVLGRRGIVVRPAHDAGNCAGERPLRSRRTSRRGARLWVLGARGRSVAIPHVGVSRSADAHTLRLGVGCGWGERRSGTSRASSPRRSARCGSAIATASGECSTSESRRAARERRARWVRARSVAAERPALVGVGRRTCPAGVAPSLTMHACGANAHAGEFIAFATDVKDG